MQGENDVPTSKWSWEELQAYDDFMDSWANSQLLEEQLDEKVGAIAEAEETFVNEPF